MNVEKNCPSLPKDAAQAHAAQRAATTPLLVSFIAGDVGAWRIDRITPVSGKSLATASRLDVVEDNSAMLGLPAVWALRGATRNTRYTTRAEQKKKKGGKKKKRARRTFCSGWTAERAGGEDDVSLGLDDQRIRHDPSRGWMGFLLFIHRNGVLPAVVCGWCGHAYGRSGICARLSLDPNAVCLTVDEEIV